MSHKKIESKAMTSIKESLEKEMLRLQRLRKENSKWWEDKSRSDWAREEFGENLDTITQDAIERAEDGICQVCGRIFKIEERYLRLTFSFCKEYECGINICYLCLLSMAEEVRDESLPRLREAARS